MRGMACVSARASSRQRKKHGKNNINRRQAWQQAAASSAAIKTINRAQHGVKLYQRQTLSSIMAYRHERRNDIKAARHIAPRQPSKAISMI